jgi:hypothetical protein
MSIGSIAKKGVKLLPVILTYLPAIIDLFREVKKAVKKPKAEVPGASAANDG